MHQYLRLTGEKFENTLERAKVLAMNNSGKQNYEWYRNQVLQLLKQAENIRPLRRSEFITMYGIEAWNDYTNQHGLPSDHKWADAKPVDPISKIADLM